MKAQLQMLLKLQGFDLEADEINSQQDDIDERLAEVQRVLGHLQRDLEEQQSQLSETEQLHAEKTEEYDEVAERYKQSKARLSKVSNTKEYSAIEQEIENVKRQQAQLEEELVQLLEAIESTRESITEKTTKIETLRATVSEEEGRTAKELSDLEGRLDTILEQRTSVESDVARDILRRYTFNRSRRQGLAVVPAHGGSCQGCHMALPPQLYIELQRGTTMHFCPSCQRILFFEEAQGAQSK